MSFVRAALFALVSAIVVATAAGCAGSEATASRGARGCETIVRSGGTRLVVPPTPSVSGVLISRHRVRAAWSFPRVPDECWPIEVLVSVIQTKTRLPWNTKVAVNPGVDSGTVVIETPDFDTPSSEGLASTFLASGARSEVARFRITRPANLPPDPVKVLPVTAPAGTPTHCAGKATVGNDPAGDVLTYGVGDPPTQVARMTEALARIDITRIAVKINGRKMCATFTFARPLPAGEKFRVSLNMHNTQRDICCATLSFRRRQGRLELGYHPINGELEPVAEAGAAVRGRTLMITGVVPPPNRWNGQHQRVPAPANVGWSATAVYYPRKYGPYFGDWLPRHEPINQPFIRQRDGRTVRPN